MKIFILCVVFVISFCSISIADDVILLKTVDGKRITMSDFERIISYYDDEKKKALAQNPQFKATILQRLAQGEAIARVARKEGFDKRADIREQLDLMSNDLLAAQYLRQEVVGKITVSEDDMRGFYKAHLDQFRFPETIRVRQILIKVDQATSEREKAQKKEEAEEVLFRIKGGGDFAQLATEFSQDEGSRAKGGDIGFVQRGKLSADIENIVFSLKPGEVSDIIGTQSGFHIIKVEEKREALVEPYDKVKDKIREKVLADFKKAKLDEFVEKAMRDAGIEINIEPFLPKQ